MVAAVAEELDQNNIITVDEWDYVPLSEVAPDAFFQKTVPAGAYNLALTGHKFHTFSYKKGARAGQESKFLSLFFTVVKDSTPQGSAQAGKRIFPKSLFPSSDTTGKLKLLEVSAGEDLLKDDAEPVGAWLDRLKTAGCVFLMDVTEYEETYQGNTSKKNDINWQKGVRVGNVDAA